MEQYNKLSLEWGCRRGMLELDNIIMPFYKEEFEQLPPRQKALFVELLSYTDPQLFSWFMNQSKAPTEELQHLIEQIKAKLITKK
ncbi:hypothetical protein CEP49_04975 [Mergibacter septicus]|uniref:FAD assembly factor SdhE n=1 Tax=Mergibacter septicus TaxID=221402 RepID=UPI0011798933|nr:succinate dehydrogenase assembly factor 2 [Mergibacter septicus]AWX13954.1 hypothetical protein CEP49_04975 [Mergibacter septicus]